MAEKAAESDALRTVRAKFVGKWRLVNSDNFEAFLQEMGAPYIARKMAGFSKPECEISIIDDKIKVHSWTTFWSQEDLIELDKTYERDIQKTKMKVSAKFDDGKIVSHLEPLDGSKIKPQIQTRSVEGEKMVLTLQVGDITAKRIFERV